MPSMRCLMTAGEALKRENIAGYNCSYVAVDRVQAFDEILYVLMNGTGVGFSVERQHTAKLPSVAEEFHPTDTIIFDNERRNKELLKQIDKTIDRGYKVVLWPDNLKEKDINDMILSGKTKQEIKSTIEENTYQGNMAKIRLTTWRKINVK